MEHSSAAELADLIAQASTEQLAICNALEQIADTLNEPSARQACIHFSRALGPAISRCHRIEEEVLFPALTEVAGNRAGFADMIERLKRDHYEDECFAEEVQEALLDYATGLGRLSTDAIGYMLRGFFFAKRRHIALEIEVLRPLVIVGASGSSQPNRD